MTHTKTFRPQINISTPAALLLLDDDVQRVFIHFLIVWFKKIMGMAVILNRRQCRRWKWADNWFPVAAWFWRSCRWRSCLAALMRLLMKRFNQVPLKQQWGELKCKRRVWSQLVVFALAVSPVSVTLLHTWRLLSSLFTFPNHLLLQTTFFSSFLLLTFSSFPSSWWQVEILCGFANFFTSDLVSIQTTNQRRKKLCKVIIISS